MVGVLLFMLGSSVCVFATSFSVFCLGRILQGIGVGGGLSLARVIIRDTYAGMALAVKTSQMAVFVSITPALAPFIGGLLQNTFGFRSVFVFLLGYGALLLCLLVFCFKESIHQKEKSLSLSRTFKHYKDLVSNFHFMHYVIIAGIAFSSVILYANVVPFIVQDQLHLSAKLNGEILLLAALGLSISCLINSRIVQHLGPRKLLSLGLLILTLTGLLLVITDYLFGLSLVTLIPLVFLITLACGFMFPNAVALAFSKINVNIGVAGALYGFFQIFTSMVVNFILNTIPTQGQVVLGVFYLTLGLCGLCLLAYQQNKLEISPDEKMIETAH